MAKHQNQVVGRRMDMRRPRCAAAALVFVAACSGHSRQTSTFAGTAMQPTSRLQQPFAATSRGSSCVTAGAAAAGGQVEVSLPINTGRVRVTLQQHLGETSAFTVVDASLPLGLLIEQRETDELFVVEDIRAGGSVAMGQVDIKVGDIVHALTTSDGDRKILVETKTLKDADGLVDAIVGNDDGLITLVVERAAPTSGLGGLGFLEEVARMF